MSFLESVIQKTKKLEGVLEEKYQAVGRGLHEKATSVGHKLDPSTLKQIRFIASVRNKLVHEADYRFDGNEDAFLNKCDEVINSLFNRQRQTEAYAPPQYIPKPVEPAPSYKPDFVRITQQNPATALNGTNYSEHVSKSYSSLPSPESRSASKNLLPAIEDGLKKIGHAILVGVCLYPIIGLGGCITRIAVQGSPPNPISQTQASNTWLSSPLKSWTTEAIIIPLLIVAITFFAGLIKIGQVNLILTIFLAIFGIAATLLIGNSLISSIKRDPLPTPVVNNPSQAGIVGTMREVNATNLSMRSGPGINYSVVATFPKKTRIVSYGETTNVGSELWTQASTPDGRIKGWVNRKFLSP